MKSRRKARILAFQALYHWDMNEIDREELLDFSWSNEEIEDEVRIFAHFLLSGTLDHIEEIDKIIDEHLRHWEFKRIPRVDLALLRQGIFSLLYQKDIPSVVTINEAIDLAKKFGGEKSYKFINGLLDNVRKKSP